MYLRYGFWLFLITFLLFIGGVCYLQGEDEVVATLWLSEQMPRVSEWLVSLAHSMPNIYHQGWVDHHLPDIMWSTAFAMIICGIWVNQLSVLKLLLLGMGCAIFYEALQLFGIARGTFDNWDLMYSLCAGLVGSFITYLLLRKAKYNYKEQTDENSPN